MHFRETEEGQAADGPQSGAQRWADALCLLDAVSPQLLDARGGWRGAEGSCCRTLDRGRGKPGKGRREDIWVKNPRPRVRFPGPSGHFSRHPG